MQGRQIAIVIVAGLVAFGAAFGIGKAAGGGGSAKATAEKSVGLKSVEVASAPAVRGVETGGALPAFKAAPKPKKNKPAQTQTDPGPTRPAPAPAPSAPPRPAAPTPPPERPAPKPTPKPPGDDGGVTGGGQD